MSTFRKAERKTAKLRAALCGTSGSGKTYSALLLARGLAGESGRIALLDTERGSGELYADLFEYDVAQITPPFTPERYITLIREASHSYDVLIVDSLSHAWAGEGGILEMHDNATKADRGGNSYTAWRNVTPQHNALVEAILTAPCHVIVTMRSKTAYELVDDGKGKKKPIKIGLAPIQREGMEYEFTLVFDLSVENHIATASKDRTRLWDTRNEIIAVRHGTELRKWLESGKPADKESLQPTPGFDWDAADQTIAAFDDKQELIKWLAKTRLARGWEPIQQEYETLRLACAERANQIDAAERAKQLEAAVEKTNEL
jgi:hypothetical protein